MSARNGSYRDRLADMPDLVSVRDMMESGGLTYRSAHATIDRLRKRGYLKRVGANSGLQYNLWKRPEIDPESESPDLSALTSALVDHGIAPTAVEIGAGAMCAGGWASWKRFERVRELAHRVGRASGNKRDHAITNMPGVTMCGRSRKWYEAIREAPRVTGKYGDVVSTFGERVPALDPAWAWADAALYGDVVMPDEDEIAEGIADEFDRDEEECVAEMARALSALETTREGLDADGAWEALAELCDRLDVDVPEPDFVSAPAL